LLLCGKLQWIMKTNELSKKEALNYVFKNSPVISIRFDKRKTIVKQVLSLYTIGDLLEIEAKKMSRINTCNKYYAPILRYRDLIDNQKSAPSNYKKVLISSNTAIYIASQTYGLKDYNKSVFFENTENNRIKAILINRLINKAV
jgi:hypothetical protein